MALSWSGCGGPSTNSKFARSSASRLAAVLSVEVLDQPVVGEDLHLVVGEGDGEEVLGAAGVGARGVR